MLEKEPTSNLHLEILLTEFYPFTKRVQLEINSVKSNTVKLTNSSNNNCIHCVVSSFKMDSKRFFPYFYFELQNRPLMKEDLSNY